MSKSWVIYKHTDPIGKVYIGMTCASNPEHRWAKGMKYKDQPRFFSAIVKYGWDNFSHEIVLRDLEYEEACEAEKRMICEYNSCDRRYGYNISPGGESSIPYGERAISEATREEMRFKQSESMKEKWKDPSFREKTLTALRENAKRPEYRQHVSDGVKHALKDESLRKQRSEAMKKRLRDDVFKEKCVASLRNSQGKIMRPVMCVETGVQYPSIAQASRESGVSISAIHKSATHRTSKTETHWEYVG